MKILACLLLLTVAAAAQTAPVAPATPSAPPAPVAPALPKSARNATPPIESELSRIDLDFKGGSPAALIDALSKALGKQVNAIIDESDASVQLPPIHVRNTTLSSVFSALATATAREVAVPTSIQGGLSGGQVRNMSLSYRTVQSQFLPTGNPVTDDTVWSFVSNEPEAESMAAVAKNPERTLRHFQLGTYLNEKLSVEDITTAIRTGWEMLNTPDKPELKFHKETGILIAVGDPKLLEQIPQVLQELQPQAPRTNNNNFQRRSERGQSGQPPLSPESAPGLRP